MPSSELVLARYGVIGAFDLGGLRVRWARRAGDAVPVWLASAPSIALAGTADEWQRVLDGTGRHTVGVSTWARAVDLGVEDGALVVAYAPFSGAALSDLGTPGLALDRALDLVVALGDALATLHGQGLAHGLLRPDLVAVDAEGGVRIAGLGLAEVLLRFGSAPALAGAVPAALRAPELGFADRLDPALDVFAFAGIVTELVTGRRPETPFETPRRFGLDLGDAFEAALARAIALDPGARPVDLQRFSRELAELARSPSAAAVSNVETASRPDHAPMTLEALTPEPVARERPAPAPARFSWATVLLVLAPIALGVLMLVGGATAVVVFALRDGRIPGVTGSASPAAPAPAPPHAAAPPPTASPLQAQSDGRTPNRAEPPAPQRPTPSPGGERTRPLEATALLPVTSSRPIWGTVDALATVALFGDLECVPTRAALRSTLRLQSQLGSGVRFVFYQAPEETHPHAREASRMLAQATLRHGPDIAWRLLGDVAESTAPATPDHFVRWLGAAGLPGGPALMADGRAASDQLDEDAKLGILLDLRATPTLFVNGARLEGTPADAVLERRIAEESRAVRWLRAEGMPAEEAYARRVRRNLINVEVGAADRACIPENGAPVDGPGDALVTVVEFSDFECPHCRAVQPALRNVLAKHRANVRRVWRSFALPQHERARRVASFALAARITGGDSAFWQLHDALFGVGALEDAELSALASRLGLNGDALLAAVDDPRTAVDLRTDEALAAELELAGTPTLFVNGRRLSGAVPEAILEAVVAEEIAAARRVVRRGTAPSGFSTVLCGPSPTR